jgi:glycosyltransferase involved in cell wall biosynthesis
MSRIVYVCADAGIPVFGTKGASIHVQEVIRAMRRMGMHVELVAARTGGEPPADLADLHVTVVRSDANGERAEREQVNIAANADFAAAVERLAPFDLLYERYSLWSYAAAETAHDLGARVIVEVNAPLIEEQRTHRGLVDEDGARQSAARLFAAADGVVAVSQEVASYVEAQGWASDRVHVVPNGVDAERFAVDAQPARREPGTFTVGFVGSLKPWHGLAVLVDAFARLHARRDDARLLIVGDGPGRAAVEAAIDARGLRGAVHLSGAVAAQSIPAWLASIDVATAPYDAAEGFYFSPLKLYEYMAAGRAIVASATGQVRDVIRDGFNGLLCAPGDPNALADALERLAIDPELRARLGAAARQSARDEHSWRARVRTILAIAGVGNERLVPEEPQ